MRLDPERETQLRQRKSFRAARFKEADLDGLLGELDYLRAEVERETAFASEVRRQVKAAPAAAVEVTPVA